MSQPGLRGPASLQRWRDDILARLLPLVAVVLVGTTVLYVSLGKLDLGRGFGPALAACAALAVVGAFLPRSRYGARVALCTVGLAGACTIALLSGGLEVPNAFLGLMLVAVMLALMVGRRWALIGGATALALIVATGILVVRGHVTPDPRVDPRDAMPWVRVAVMFGAVTMLAVLAVDHLVGHLRDQLAERERALDELEQATEARFAAQARQRDLELRLVQAEKLEVVGRLAGGVAHDFNNLLTVINGTADILAGELPADHADRELIDDIRAAGERAVLITRQLLSFSRREMVEPHLIDVGQAVTDMRPLLQRLLGEKVTLTTTVGAGRLQVSIDPGQLTQVVVNLAVNAREAMLDGGKVTIAVEADGDRVALWVSDTGPGIDLGVRPYLFEPFHTTKRNGTGLGLSTVHRIVRAGGGDIELTSPPGDGASFRVRLPSASEVAVADRGADREPAERGSEIILLVDDEPALRSLAARALRDAGYTVLEAPHGEGATSAAERAGTIDLLVTDVVMPGISGRALADRLRGQRPGLRALFMSGYTDDVILRAGVSSGEMPFLAKPFSPRDLIRKVREVLDRPPPAG